MGRRRRGRQGAEGLGADPHSDSNWPNSGKRATEALANVPDDEVEMIVETNARRMLNFPRAA